MISGKLDRNEHVIIVLRKHWFMFSLQVLILVLGALVPLVIAVYIPPEGLMALAQIGASANFLTFLYILWLLAMWHLIFISWTTYYLDAWVVTNRRVIDIDQQGLFKRTVTTLMIEKVQDITVDTQGLLATLLGYGTLTIYTAAAADPDIVIRFAAHPQYAKDRIVEHQRRAMSARPNGNYL